MRPYAAVAVYYGLHETPFDFYRYTEFALRRFVTGAGLELVHLESIGGVPEIMMDVFAKSAAAGVPIVGRPIAVGAQWLTAPTLRTGLGRKLSDATKKRFPLDYFLIAMKPQ